MDLQARLNQLVKHGIGSKECSVLYAVTSHPMDALVHCVRNHCSTILIPMNTSYEPRGVYSVLCSEIPEFKSAISTEQATLGNAVQVNLKVQVRDHHVDDICLTQMFVQDTYGRQKPKGEHHVDLESLRFAMLDVLETTTGDLAMFFFGNETEHGTPWDKIESVLNNVLDFTGRKLTVFIPTYAKDDFVGAVRIPSYTHKKKPL